MKDSSSQYGMWADWVLRVALAVVFINAGTMKLFTMGVGNFATAMNLPEPIAWLVALGELGAGLGIVVAGLMKNDMGEKLTRASGGIIALIMAGAIILVKSKGFDGGFQQGIAGMYPDIALFAIGLHYLLGCGCCGGMCETKKK
ncbi:MAG TPA: DoxX family protein [Candidatus Gracilibacteria bacterium]|nr:DoxX family protein [Candidatus Gracilibacteria bacterium]